MQQPDCSINGGSNQELGDLTDRDLDCTLLESIFYNEMIMLGEGFDFSMFEQETFEASNKLEPDLPPLDQGNSQKILPQHVSTSSQVESIVSHKNHGAARTNNRPRKKSKLAASTRSGPPIEPVGSQKAPSTTSIANAQVQVDHVTTMNSPTLPTNSASEPTGFQTTTSALPNTQDHQVSKVVSQFSLLASRLGIMLPNSIMESLTAAAIQRTHPSTMATLEQSKTNTDRLFRSSTLEDASDISDSSDMDDDDGMDDQRTSSKGSFMQTSFEDPRDNKRKHPIDSDAVDGIKKTQKSSSFTKRKKLPRLEDCEKRLAQLQAENDVLKRHHEHVTNKTNKLDQERKDMDSKIHEIVKCSMEASSMFPSMAQELNAILPKFREMYSDYGLHRKEELAFHLNQLEKLAVPANFTKMSLWTLGQNESFYTKPKLNPIAGILKKELEITPAQGRKIISQREKIRALCTNIQQCLALITKLKTLCEHKQRIFHDRLSKVQEILSPLQVAKLLAWIDGHSDVLDGVCPGWGSEQLRK